MADHFKGFKVVGSYTTKEAVADGVLVDLSTVGRIPIYAPVCRGIRYATRSLPCGMLSSRQTTLR
jgi:type I site-specific restriction endonuclease